MNRDHHLLLLESLNSFFSGESHDKVFRQFTGDEEGKMKKKKVRNERCCLI